MPSVRVAFVVVLAVVATALLAALPRRALAGGGPAETVVLVNAASEDSRRVADHYVKARGIPARLVCEVRCATALEVPVADFVRDVVDPLRTFLRARGVESRVSFVVMTQGMPIRARTPGGQVSTAALLSLLDTPVAGEDQGRMPRYPNPYREGPAPRGPLVGGGRFLLVTALLSTTADEAIALVDRSVASDGTAPKDALFAYQDARPAAHVRNDAYDAARADVEKLGMRTEHAKVGAAEVNGRKRVMGYMAGGVYSALTAEGVASNEYLPGAICDHLQSFGAVPQNFDPDPKKHSQFSICHMVRAGITGVHGAVAEPYNVAFPDARMFETYIAGFTLAETFHRHAPLAYWMNLVLGDPLCAPYAERPKVSLEIEGDRVTAKAPGAVRTDLYVGARLLASADGDTVTASLEGAPEWVSGGRHEILAEATGPGACEPRGWKLGSVSLTVREGPPATPPAVAVGELSVQAPDSVVAGEAFSVRVLPLGPIGGPAEGWRGRVEVRLATPPIRLAKLDVESVPEGGVEVPVTLTRAGEVEFAVSLPDQAVRRTRKVRVDPAAPHHATTPLDRVPLGQATDVDVVIEDAFGNRAPFEGELSVAVPTDPFAKLPAPVRVAKADGGRAVLRDLVLTRAGRHELVFTDGSGKRWSQPGEGAEAVHAPLRAWLAAQAFRGDEAAKAFAADPSAGADRDGAVANGSVWRRVRARGDDIALLAQGTKDGDALVAVAFVRALNPSKVRLLGAAASRMVVFVDGKPVWDGAPKGADPRGKREPLADVEFAEGLHRVTVVLERKDRAASFALEIDDGAGKHVDSVMAEAAATSDAPAAFVVSGRVRRGGGGIPGAKVTVKGSDGKERAATTGPDGVWFVEGVPAGDAEVRAEWKHPLSPATRSVTLSDAHAADVDFVAEDRTPPTVKVDGVAPRYGKKLRLVPAVEDDDAVRDVRLLVDGEEVARATAAPWTLEGDVGLKTRGRHEVVVVATDPSGNEGRSAPASVALVDDAKGPAVKVAGITANAQLKKKATLTATVTDDLPVASVAFRLDGKDLGAPRTAAPWTADVDPAGLADGAHVVEVVARDLDGNETRTEVKFRTRK